MRSSGSQIGLTAGQEWAEGQGQITRGSANSLRLSSALPDFIATPTRSVRCEDQGIILFSWLVTRNILVGSVRANCGQGVGSLGFRTGCSWRMGFEASQSGLQYRGVRDRSQLNGANAAYSLGCGLSQA